MTSGDSGLMPEAVLPLLGRYGFAPLGHGPAAGERARADLQSCAVPRDLVQDCAPRLSAVVGEWTGASSILLSSEAAVREASTTTLSISTWLGTPIARDPFNSDSAEWGLPALQLEDGYPTVYRTFASNVRQFGMQDRIVPMPMDPLDAAELLMQLNIRPRVVWITGGYRYVTSYRLVHAFSSVLDDTDPHAFIGIDNVNETWQQHAAAMAAIVRDRGWRLMRRGSAAVALRREQTDLADRMSLAGWYLVSL